MASGRWLGTRLELLASVLIAAVALAAVVVSQDAGRYTFEPVYNAPVLSGHPLLSGQFS